MPVREGNRYLAHLIIVGNEKGGAGKSTVSMHLGTALVRMGHRVSAIDLDLRQRTFSRYIENRQAFVNEIGQNLACPELFELPQIDPETIPSGEHLSDHRLSAALNNAEKNSDFVLIDCPGSHTRLSQMAHSLADTLLTPLNDSFVDFDLLAHTDASGENITGPSVYSEMVWNARQSRAQAGMKPIDWIVVRNRIASQRMMNKEKIERVVKMLSKRVGFRVAPGFSERVVFRELFPKGLTLLDLKDIGIRQMNISNISARQELRDLIKALDLPGVKVNF